MSEVPGDGLRETRKAGRGRRGAQGPSSGGNSEGVTGRDAGTRVIRGLDWGPRRGQAADSPLLVCAGPWVRSGGSD